MDPFGVERTVITDLDEEGKMGLTKNVVEGLYRELERLDTAFTAIAQKMHANQ